MFDSPRRGFLKVAGAGVAAAGAAVAVPALGRGSSAAAKPVVPASASGAVVAYIADVHGSELSVMVEGREVLITDKDLVARLARHIHTGGRASV